MKQLVAVTVALLLHDSARADMGLPWPTRRVPVRVTITPAPPPPGVELFLNAPGGVRRMPTDSPLVLESDRTTGGVMFTVYAVQAVALKPFDGAVPPADWFHRHDNPQWRLIGGERVRGVIDFFDDRSAVVEEYQLERWPTEGMRLVKVSENEGSWWFRWATVFTAGVMAPVAIVWLGIWFTSRFARRLFRPRPSPPPPEVAG